MVLYLMLMAIAAFSVLAIHHHHYDRTVPIVVELLGENGDWEDSVCGEHHCQHSSAQKCSNTSAPIIAQQKKCELSRTVAVSFAAMLEYKCQEIIKILFKNHEQPLPNCKGAIFAVRGPPEYYSFYA